MYSALHSIINYLKNKTEPALLPHSSFYCEKNKPQKTTHSLLMKKLKETKNKEMHLNVAHSGLDRQNKERKRKDRKRTTFESQN